MLTHVVQKGTEDEWPIKYELFGDVNSKNLIVMVHGGGMDNKEQGRFLVAKHTSKTGPKEKGWTWDPEKQLLTKNAFGKILIKKPEDKGWKFNPEKGVWTKSEFEYQDIGNYERITNNLADYDCCILRMDLRNHGKSKKDGKDDERDTSFIRDANDVADLVNYVLKKHSNMQSISFVGSCGGALISQYLLTDPNNKNIREKTKSCEFISPLNNERLSTPDKDPNSFNTRKYYAIQAGKQVTAMPGMREGPKTLEEAEQNLRLHKRFAELQIPTTICLGHTDRLLQFTYMRNLVKQMQRINHDIKRYTMMPTKNMDFTENNEDETIQHYSPRADHCLHEPKPSRKCTNIITNNLIDCLQLQKLNQNTI